MSDIYKGELQDYQGNTVYGHSEADLIFCADGETVQQKLSKQEQIFGEATGSSGSLEVNDPKVLATTEATHKLAENMGGLRFGVDSEGNYGYFKEGADTVTPFKTGSTIIDCGTSASFNVKTYYDGDYTKLTADNFIVGLNTVNVAASSDGSYASTVSGASSSNITKTYDATTGEFSCTGLSAGFVNYHTANRYTCNVAASANISIYLIV